MVILLDFSDIFGEKPVDLLAKLRICRISKYIPWKTRGKSG
jgi:hypothetical protein